MDSGALSLSGFNFRKSNIMTKNYVNTRNNILHDTRTHPCLKNYFIKLYLHNLDQALNKIYGYKIFKNLHIKF